MVLKNKKLDSAEGFFFLLRVKLNHNHYFLKTEKYVLEKNKLSRIHHEIFTFYL